MSRVQTKAQKVHVIVFTILWASLCVFNLAVLILGEETITGIPILRTIWDKDFYICIAVLIADVITAWILWPRKKKRS